LRADGTVIATIGKSGDIPVTAPLSYRLPGALPGGGGATGGGSDNGGGSSTGGGSDNGGGTTTRGGPPAPGRAPPPRGGPPRGRGLRHRGRAPGGGGVEQRWRQLDGRHHDPGLRLNGFPPAEPADHTPRLQLAPLQEEGGEEAGPAPQAGRASQADRARAEE